MLLKPFMNLSAIIRGNLSFINLEEINPAQSPLLVHTPRRSLDNKPYSKHPRSKTSPLHQKLPHNHQEERLPLWLFSRLVGYVDGRAYVGHADAQHEVEFLTAGLGFGLLIEDVNVIVLHLF